MKTELTRADVYASVVRILTRLSRDRYLSQRECGFILRRILDKKQRQCNFLLRFHNYEPPGFGVGLLRGKPPVCPVTGPPSAVFLYNRLRKIDELKDRKAKAELEILRFHLKEGDYKWLKYR